MFPLIINETNARRTDRRQATQESTIRCSCKFLTYDVPRFHVGFSSGHQIVQIVYISLPFSFFLSLTLSSCLHSSKIKARPNFGTVLFDSSKWTTNIQ